MLFQKKLHFLISAVCVLLLFSGCKSYSEDKDTLIGVDQFISPDYNWQGVDLDTLYVFFEDKFWNIRMIDDKGLSMILVNKRPVYHGSSIASEVLFNLVKYRETGVYSFMNKTLLLVDRMDEISVEINGAKYFTISFSYLLHKDETQVMESPWVSALVQGKMLAVYTRLFKQTRDSAYFYSASKIFQSFLKYKHKNDYYWVSYIDNDSLLWLEEYPLPKPCNTLNGMIAAIFGIYEYYQLTHDPEVKKVLDGAVHTIALSISKFRNENAKSYYCLKHKVKNVNYHSVHIYQLLNLYRITGNNYFREMAIKLDGDYIVPDKIKRYKI